MSLQHKNARCFILIHALWFTAMDRGELMAAIERRAFDARIGLHKLCGQAGVSGTIATRWRRGEAIPTLPTIGKLEAKLDELGA